MPRSDRDADSAPAPESASTPDAPPSSGQTAARPDPARPEDPAMRDFVIDAARLIGDSHCDDVQVFDVRGLSQLTDYIIIATGTSDRQMKSVAGDVAELGRERGLHRFGSERDDSSTWIVLDFVETMVHLFEPATRGHYDLEMMWGDAPRIAWRRG